MKSRFRKLRIESLEGRSVLSTTAFADFNHDGLMDEAVVTDPTTITVSLGNPDGSYRVSETLKAPKSVPIYSINVGDYNGDGKLDISGGGVTDRFYSSTWLGNGDGTFGNRNTQKQPLIKGGF